MGLNSLVSRVIGNDCVIYVYDVMCGRDQVTLNVLCVTDDGLDVPALVVNSHEQIVIAVAWERHVVENRLSKIVEDDLCNFCINRYRVLCPAQSSYQSPSK